MGFFDFLKAKKTAVENEKISSSKLESWLENQKSEIQSREKYFYNLIKERVSILKNELEKNKKILENIDLSGKKAEERIKLIVKENLYYYIINFRRLIENLDSLTETSPEILIEKINTIFFNFERKSYMNFEKATFLIGKELEAVKITIRNFSKDLNSMIGDNKNILEKKKIIISVEKNIEEMKNAENARKEAEENIKSGREKITGYENKIKNIKKDIESIKKSKEFLEEKRKEQELQERKHRLKKEFYNLKEMIDFKSLASAFHSDEKKMNKLKEFNGDFENLIEDYEYLWPLIEEAGIMTKAETQGLSERIQNLLDSRNRINLMSSKENKIQKDIDNLGNEIKSLDSKILLRGEEISREMKKQDRFQEAENKLKDSIKENLNKISINLEDS